MRRIIQVLLCCLIWNISQAQTPLFDWAYNLGDNGNVYSRSMILDDAGNIYTIGVFAWGPIDFDPGLDSFKLTSAGSNDIYVSKLDASGDFIWAKNFGGTDRDEGVAIAIDGSGNVYFTGHFSDSADFDPGVGVFNLISVGGNEIFVCKLDANGDFLWAKQMGSNSSDEGESIAVDAAGNVYVTGCFQQTVDFDPGTGTTNLTSNGRCDIFICQFNSSGDFQWVKQIGSSDQDHANALVLDDNSNIYLTGSFTDTVDFNPGAGVFEFISSNGTGGYILKLDASGDFLWAKQLEDHVYGNTITLDVLGNIYVGGGGAGIAIIKLNAAGTIIWSKVLMGSNSNAVSLAVDATGNVYTTGYFRNTVDFDPGTDSVIFNSSGFASYLNKLDASGNYIWAYQIGGNSFDDHGTAIALDASENIYAFGHFRNTIDFDPGPDTFRISAPSYDSYLLKWNQALVGIEESISGAEVNIYPNPTSSITNIDLSEWKDVSVKVYSTAGQLIHHQEHIKDSIYQFELKGANGMYIVELISQGHFMHFKLMKN